MENFNKIAVISQHPELNKLFQHWYKLHRCTHDSWPRLFNTKEHQRRVIRRERMRDRFVIAACEKFGIGEYKTKRIDHEYCLCWHE